MIAEDFGKGLAKTKDQGGDDSVRKTQPFAHEINSHNTLGSETTPITHETSLAASRSAQSLRFHSSPAIAKKARPTGRSTAPAATIFSLNEYLPIALQSSNLS